MFINQYFTTKWYTFISLGRLWRKNIGNDLHIVLLKKSIIQCHYVVNICDAAVVWDKSQWDLSRLNIYTDAFCESQSRGSSDSGNTALNASSRCV